MDVYNIFQWEFDCELVKTHVIFERCWARGDTTRSLARAAVTLADDGE